MTKRNFQTLEVLTDAYWLSQIEREFGGPLDDDTKRAVLDLLFEYGYVYPRSPAALKHFRKIRTCADYLLGSIRAGDLADRLEELRTLIDRVLRPRLLMSQMEFTARALAICPPDLSPRKRNAFIHMIHKLAGEPKTKHNVRKLVERAKRDKSEFK